MERFEVNKSKMPAALKILLFMFLIYADIGIITIFLSLSPAVVETLNTNKLLSLVISQVLLIFPSLPLYMLITKQNHNDILPLKPLGWKNAAFILLMTILLNPAISLISGITSLFYPNAAISITDTLTMENLPAAFIIIAILPILTEEICFRGVVLSAAKEWKVIYAAIISGTLFGLIHMNLQQIPYALFMGIIFSLYVIHTRSIYSSMLAHFLVNAPNVLLALTISDKPDISGITEEVILSLIILAVFAVIFFLLFLIVYKRFKLYNQKRFSL